MLWIKSVYLPSKSDDEWSLNKNPQTRSMDHSFPPEIWCFIFCSVLPCERLKLSFFFARMGHVESKWESGGSKFLSLLLFTGEKLRSDTRALQIAAGLLYLVSTRLTSSQKPTTLCKCHSDLFLKQVTCGWKHLTLINRRHGSESPDSELVSMVITAVTTPASLCAGVPLKQ